MIWSIPLTTEVRSGTVTLDLIDIVSLLVGYGAV